MSHASTDSTHSSPDASARPEANRNVSERRRYRRFKVGGVVGVQCPTFEPDGGLVSVRKRSLLGLLAGDSELEQLRDLSRGGLSFETQQRFEPGQRVRLSLFLRCWCEPMELSGEVRWVRSIYRGMVDVVGIQFDAFGSSRGCNPVEALAALARLEAKYADAIDEPAKS
jgi:hypothetical protein